MPEEIEPLVRRSRKGSGRQSVLAIRVQDSTLEALDKYAARHNLTRADAARVLLRAGFKAEGLQ